MAARIGINGFGRIGGLGLRAGWGKPGLRFSRVNEIATHTKGSAHLLKFDSVHGVWQHEAWADDGELVIDGQLLACTPNTEIEATASLIHAAGRRAAGCR